MSLALSIPEFCKEHGISRAFFYLLQKTNSAPTTMKVGRRRLISVEAAADWRRKMESGDGEAINKTPDADK